VRPFFIATLAALALMLCAADAAAQEANPSPAPRTSAEEGFELNIAERRITVAENYEASTAVEVGDDAARGLNLRARLARRAPRQPPATDRRGRRRD
jgi:hypothetical protein